MMAMDLPAEAMTTKFTAVDKAAMKTKNEGKWDRLQCDFVLKTVRTTY